MAITPYSTPLQYQYKPLNLMAFAEPLMKMQEKYDLTKASLEDSDVKATALQYATDPAKAKALEELYRTKRDELVANLLETKNYTQAASKLKQLNKLWLEDPERVALETNYKTFIERDKEEAARVAKGNLEKEEYEQWRRGELRKFEEAGGTAFRQDAANPTGTYNTITGKVGRRINLQKDFDAEKKDIASKIKAKEWTGALRSLGIEPNSGDAQFVKSSFEKLSAEEIEKKVEDYMINLERYRPWLQEKANYNFDDYLYANDKGESLQRLSTSLIDKNLEANERYIKKLEEDKKTDTEDYKRALENRDILLDQRSNPDPNVVRGLYTRDYMNRQYDAAALGEVFEINNVKSDYTFRDIPNGGSGSDFTLAGTVGRTSPTTKELVSVNLEANRNEAIRDMKPSITEFNNIASGKMRTLSMGAKGTALRRQMEANPAMAVPRQEKILAIFQQSKDATDFHRKLFNAGLASGVGQTTTKEIFTALSNSKTNQLAANALQKTKEGYNNFIDSDSQIKSINEAILKDKDFGIFLKKSEKEKTGTNLATVQKLAEAWGTTVEKLIQDGVVERSTSVTGQAGLPVADNFRVSPNNIAKAYGYDDLEDAIDKGFNFSAAGANSLAQKINEARDSAAAKALSGNEMGVRIVGDKIIDKAMGDELLNSSELTSFKPVYSKNWADIPGFDEEGNMLAGTKLDSRVTPKIVMRANQVVMQVPYTYKNEDGKDVTSTVEVKAKPGEKLFFEKILRRTAINNYQLREEDSLANQTFNDAAVGLYNLMTDSNITPQSAASMNVDKNSRKAILETIPTRKEGTTIQLVKEYVEGAKPTYKAYVVSPTGSVPAGLEAGSVNALKVLITEQMYLQ